MPKVIPLNKREKVQSFELLALSTSAALVALQGGALPFTTDILDIGGYPLSSLGIYGDASMAGLTLDVYVSNIPVIGSGEKVNAADITAAKVVAITQSPRYVWAIVKTLSAGRVGATWTGALQS